MTEALMEKAVTVPSFEVLLVEEYAERLKIGKSTVFYWKEKGILKPGLHYFQTGKVLRFIWSLDLIMELHTKPLPKPKAEPECPVLEETLIKIDAKKLGPQKVGINLDY